MKQKPFFSVIYEDDCILAVNKSSGISVGADRWDPAKPRLDKMLEGRGKIFTLHRIDQDTSGLVIFAKDAETHRTLSVAFEGRSIEKRYIAVVHGRSAWTETACDLPLVVNGDKLHRTIIDKYRGKKALTRFRFLGAAGSYSVVAAFPETGRTHQIRAHLAALDHPVVCDPLYGSPKGVFLSAIKRSWRGEAGEEKPLLARLGLHAAAMVIPPYRPGQGDETDSRETRLTAPLPRDMAALINQMEKIAGGAFEAEMQFDTEKERHGC